MFYEIVYETGRMSVADYKDDEEAKSAVKAHNDRALNGEPGGPIGQPAERIRAVYVYEDGHPDGYNEAQTMSADVLSKELEALVKNMKDSNGVVNVDLLAMEVRGLSHPMATDRKTAFDSMYRLKETRKLDLAFLEA